MWWVAGSCPTWSSLARPRVSGEGGEGRGKKGNYEFERPAPMDRPHISIPKISGTSPAPDNATKGEGKKKKKKGKKALKRRSPVS